MKKLFALLVLISVSLPLCAQDKSKTQAAAPKAPAKAEKAAAPAEDPDVIVMPDLPLLADCSFFPSKFAACEPSYCVFRNTNTTGEKFVNAVAIGGADKDKKCFFRFERRTGGVAKNIVHCSLDAKQSEQMSGYYFKLFAYLDALYYNYSDAEKKANKAALDATRYPVLDYIKTGVCQVMPAYR